MVDVGRQKQTIPWQQVTFLPIRAPYVDDVREFTLWPLWPMLEASSPGVEPLRRGEVWEATIGGCGGWIWTL